MITRMTTMMQTIASHRSLTTIARLSHHRLLSTSSFDAMRAVCSINASAPYRCLSSSCSSHQYRAPIIVRTTHHRNCLTNSSSFINRRVQLMTSSSMSHHNRSMSTSSSSPILQTANQTRMSRIRNIGIIAHIDAGKTTTTERCLYYANKIRCIGDVDHGSTTMDFMREERERGITIQSACITIMWSNIHASPSSSSVPTAVGHPHRINLIDTPGHVDFTQQVEQSLRVLDGAVCVIDGVKGVEAQTRTVWDQAEAYNVARIVYVNKLDRDGANFDLAVRSVREKLNSVPLVIAIPLYADVTMKTGFNGVIDLLRLESWEWSTNAASSSSPLSASIMPADSGTAFTIRPIARRHAQYAEAVAARKHLVETAVEVDDQLMERWMEECEKNEDEACANIPAQAIADALRRIVVQSTSTSSSSSTTSDPSSSSPSPQSHTIVLCGSSKSNKGVQFLLNSIVDYLPSPLDKQFIEIEEIQTNNTASTSSSSSSSKSKSANKKLMSSSSTSSAAPPSRIMKSLGGDPSKDPLIALAFKVTHDLQRGAMPIVFVRVYTGVMKKGESVISVTPKNDADNNDHQLQDSKPSSTASSTPSSPASSTSPLVPPTLSSYPRERPQKLLEISADNLSFELTSIESGNIGALVGMKHTRTGDTILGSAAVVAAIAAKKYNGALSSSASDPRVGVLPGISASDPVFFCSVEASTLAAASALEVALDCIRREDPSIRVRFDEQTGQTVLAGMGELHLDIVKSRLENDWALGSEHGGGGIHFGRMRINYREGVAATTIVHDVRFTAGSITPMDSIGADAEASMSVQIEPMDTGMGVLIDIDTDGATTLPTATSPSYQSICASIQSGIRDGLARGQLLGYPMTDVRVVVSSIVSHPSSSNSSALSFRGCASRGVSQLLRSAASSHGVHLLEPMMRCDVTMSTSHIGPVLSDITSKRRGVIIDVQHSSGSGSGGVDNQQHHHNRVSMIHAEVPLSEMIGYASLLRSMTQGNGSFMMKFQEYRQVNMNIQNQLIASPP